MDHLVHTATGPIRGFAEEGSSVYLGIPFAKPPLGDLRFQAPEPVDAWDDVRECFAFGPTAPQKDPVATIIPEPVEHGDDFLNLNVYAPASDADGLPVFVYIHGGGFTSGCNRSPWYNGTRFNRDGVIVVSLGYRLGVEGFLEIEGAPSNRAVLDWIAGLQWVQDNIEAFGGDPSNVTIGGQSAGSAACLTLMVNPGAEGLFQRVIGMSGTSDSRMPRDAATELGELVAKHLGLKATVEDLSKVAPLDLVDAHVAVAGSAFSRDSLMSGFDPKAPALRPYADGETIPEHPFLAIKDGKGGSRELLSGSTECELNGLIRMQKAQLSEEQVLRGLSSMTVEGESLQRYKDELGTDDIYEVFGQVATDRAFREPLDRLLDDHANTGVATYGYQFTWPSPLFDGMVGSAHCLDIPFAFDLLGTDSVNNSLVGPDAPQALADAMHSAFVSFIKTGDPGFQRYDSKKRASMRFDTESKVVNDQLKLQREVLGGR